MLISHISDIHLGYSQFNLLEREQDIYDAFEEAVDRSISEHVELVILAGDIFHTPRPSGSSIIKLANELKKFKEASIPVYFVLGEHDINRLKDIPVPYLFHSIKLANRLEENRPIRLGKLTLFGFNKERRSNIENLLQKFQITEKLARQYKEVHDSKNIIVLHQGLIDFNKFAGELSSADLPKGFDYYAMGHYHDRIEERSNHLDGGLIAYPGSIDLTPSEGIKDVDKGFFLTDLSGNEPGTNWIKLENRRPQLAFDANFKSLSDELPTLIKKALSYKKRPIIMLKISGEKIDSKIVAAHLIKLNESCLHYVWYSAERQDLSLRIFDGVKPLDIDSELQRLARETLNSYELAEFAIRDILPTVSSGDVKTALDIVWKVYNDSKKNVRLLPDSSKEEEEEENTRQ
jgi:DNA repair exonuclease SbcCD nuclease subunit